MRKSSLGRRSSTHIPVRVPSLGGSASRTWSGKKNTGTMLKPGFSQARRSQSADRESCGNYGANRPLQRANTFGAMTPITPRNTSVHGSLPSGSVRAPKSQMASIDSNRRMSSFGGVGGKRKDTRPISEKPFQQAAQAKVQEYFDIYATDVVGPGNSIRPMNTKLFVDMMNHLLQNLDLRIVISKSNYLEELPQILRKLGYRSKVDRSWLMTVNTPHSWQHVIAVLSWLVDLNEIMDLTDPFEIMYSNNLDDQAEEMEEDEDEDPIKIDKDMVFHLKKSYQMRKDEERLVCLDEEYLEKQIVDLKCTDEDLDTLQRQNEIKKTELDKETQRKNVLSEEIQKLQEKQKAAIDDCDSMKEYIEKSKTFVDNVEVTLATKEKEIMIKRATLLKKKEELQKIQDTVNTQQISLDEIEKYQAEKIKAQRLINYHENAVREYKNSAFNVEIELAEDQKKVEKLVLEYNKCVAEKVVLEPRLKTCEIQLQLIADVAPLKTIDSNLKALKEEYKTSINELEYKKEEYGSILKRAKEDMEITREEIEKETKLLEGIESDYEKHKELAAKETEELKDNINRYQKMSKDLSEDQKQFDPAELEENRKKLKCLEHDYELILAKSKEFLKELREMINEDVVEIQPHIVNFMKKVEKIKEEL